MSHKKKSKLRVVRPAARTHRKYYRSHVSPELPTADDIRHLVYSLLSAREEQQNTIQKLETAKDALTRSNQALKSSNNELATVNAQLQKQVQDLASSHTDMDNLLNSANIATLFLDRELRVRRFTPQIRRLFRFIPTDLGRDLADIARRFQCGNFIAEVEQALAEAKARQKTVFAEDGSAFLCNIMPYRTEDDRVDGVVLTFSDVSAMMQIEAELRASEERFRSFMDNSPAISWMKDEQGRHVFLSRVYEQRFNVRWKDWQGKTDDEVWPSKIAENFRQNDRLVLDSGRTLKVVEETKDSNGDTAYWQSFKFLLHDSNGKPYVGGIAVDITQQIDTENELRSSLERIERSREEMEFIATHDELTGLPNRALFHAHLDAALAHRARTGDLLTVMFIDLDHFKQVNDGLGHDVGDELLREVAQRLLKSVREGDMAARIGGDEFAILMEQSDKLQSADIAQRILDHMSEPFRLAHKEMTITASIGIGIAPDDGTDSQTILKSADFAMYQVKSSGRSDFQFFSKKTADAAHRRLEMLMDLRHAIAGEGLFLVYQPEVCLSSNEVVGVEALIRWQHPNGLILGPEQFIDLADETGLVVPLGELVLDMACQQMAEWKAQRLAIPRISVNLSSRHFLYGNLQTSIPRILAKHKMEGQALALGIEVTEYALLNSSTKVDVKQLLSDLKKLGINISIDDFGTGYSSLAYLKHYPIDELKIDQSFVDGIAKHPEDKVITSAIMAMAKALGLRCVAEGVETQQQLDILRKQGCDVAQGYLIGRPMSPPELNKWMSTLCARKKAKKEKIFEQQTTD